MKTDRAVYLSEMTASGAAIGSFLLVYLVGMLHLGALYTLLLGWLPAAIVAFFAARAVRQLMLSLFQMRAADVLGMPEPRPATVSVPLVDDFGESVHQGRGARRR